MVGRKCIELGHGTARERLRSGVLASCGVLATEAVAESQHSKNDGILRFDYKRATNLRSENRAEWGFY